MDGEPKPRSTSWRHPNMCGRSCVTCPGSRRPYGRAAQDGNDLQQLRQDRRARLVLPALRDRDGRQATAAWVDLTVPGRGRRDRGPPDRGALDVQTRPDTKRHMLTADRSHPPRGPGPRSWRSSSPAPVASGPCRRGSSERSATSRGPPSPAPGCKPSFEWQGGHDDT